MLQQSINTKRITRQQIDSLKDDPKAFSSFLQGQNESNIIYTLEKLGRLENRYSKRPLLSLLKSSNKTIRSLVAKNLAKIRDISLLDTFVHFAKQDTSTEVRREFVSAIGRLRDERVCTGFDSTAF